MCLPDNRQEAAGQSGLSGVSVFFLLDSAPTQFCIFGQWVKCYLRLYPMSAA